MDKTNSNVLPLAMDNKENTDTDTNVLNADENTFVPATNAQPVPATSNAQNVPATNAQPRLTGKHRKSKVNTEDPQAEFL